MSTAPASHWAIRWVAPVSYTHLKTIQPRLKDNRVVLEDLTLTAEQLRAVRKIDIIACGSSYHVGMVGKYNLERLTRIRCV